MLEKLNLLYISRLSCNPWQGPTYSVPAQVTAQAKLDNVFWYNLSDVFDSEIMANLQKLAWDKLPFYHDLRDFSQADISKLPVPFNQPDLIIFEQFYDYGYQMQLIRRIERAEIPYVIIPRGELNCTAQRSKWLKKQLANWFFFYRFSRGAVAIEYLTRQEAIDSGLKWNKKQIIIPNGIHLPRKIVKNYKPLQSLNLVFCGRLDPYHKGIDLLIKACAIAKMELRSQKVLLRIYGPDRLYKRQTLEEQVRSFGLEDLISFHEGLYGDKKTNVLQQADAFIMTSRFEGHPMGLIEALAYGLPCIATTGTNMREEIDKFDAGWTADNTVESIAAALTKMLKERDQFAKKSQNARTLAAQYDWDKIAEQSHKIYEEIVEKNK